MFVDTELNQADTVSSDLALAPLTYRLYVNGANALTVSIYPFTVYTVGSGRSRVQYTLLLQCTRAVIGQESGDMTRIRIRYIVIYCNTTCTTIYRVLSE